MAQFDNASLLENEKETKARLKIALGKVNANGTKFLYYDKFKLGTKEVPLVLVDLVADMQAQVKSKFGKAPTGLGKCRLDDKDKLVFDFDSGRVKLDRLKTFLSTIGVQREVADEDEEPPADKKPKTIDGPEPKASQPDARSELAKRMTAFAAELKDLKPELRDSFEVQLKKAGTLAATNEGAALKLMGQLDEMLKKALSKGGEEVGGLQAALAAAKTDVDKAIGGLPKEPAVLEADIQKSSQYQAYAAFVKSPSSIPDAGSLKACVSQLLKQIEQVAKQATEWPAIKEKAESALKKVLTEGLSEVGKPNMAKLQTYKELDETKTAGALSKDPSVYARAAEYEKAMEAMLLKVKALIHAIKAWDVAVEKAGQAVEGEIGKLAGELREAVRKALAATSEQTAFDDIVAQGKKEVLAVGLLTKPLADLTLKVAALGEIEARRQRAAKIAGALPAKRTGFDDFLKRCNAALTKATAPLDDIAVSFRTTTMKDEIDADTLTCTNARNAVNALVAQLDTALVDLPKEPPPATSALDDAQRLLDAVLPDIDAARERITRNVNALGPQGRQREIDRLLDEAKTDPTRMLSNNRAGNIAKSLLAMKRDDVIAKIAAAVAEQHKPKLKEWFKVLQLGNASGGALKLGKVGSITVGGPTGKAIPLHMSLFLANVADPPSIDDPIDDIMDALLPPVNGHVGTHVTLEINGEKSKGNPHYFHGAASGVANDLGSDSEWSTIESAMKKKLDTEMARLKALVQQHVDRKGKWMGE